MQHKFKVTLIFFLLSIHINGKAQLCIEYATSDELNECLEKEIDKRINAYCLEHDIDFDEILSAFNTYLINAGFCTADSVGAGYKNFLKQLAAPVDRTVLIRSLDAAFLRHVISMIEKLYDVNFLQLQYMYLGDYIDDVVEKCRDAGFRDSDRDIEECPLVQLVISTLYNKFYSSVFNHVQMSGDLYPWIQTHEEAWAEEIFEKPIYGFFYLFLLSKYPHFNHIINGEAVFLVEVLDNREEVWAEYSIIIDSELASETAPKYVNYIYCPTEKLTDVVFRQSNREIINYEDVSEEIRNAFKNSTFVEGVYNNKKVKYSYMKSLQYK